jgi:hypothetical protein
VVERRGCGDGWSGLLGLERRGGRSEVGEGLRAGE